MQLWFETCGHLVKNFTWYLGPDSIKRCRLTCIGNPIVEIRRSYDRLISTMGFPILVRRHLYIEAGPCVLCCFGKTLPESHCCQHCFACCPVWVHYVMMVGNSWEDQIYDSNGQNSSLWCCSQKFLFSQFFSQWQHSFHLKAALPWAKLWGIPTLVSQHCYV